MFIRWKKRQLKEKDRRRHIGVRPGRDKSIIDGIGSYWIKEYGWKDSEDYSLGAYLVESYRNAEGKPRQRNISYLGTAQIIVKDGTKPRHGYWWIWDNFYKAMDTHSADLSTVTVLSTKIEDKLGIRMSPDEVAKIKKERDAWIAATKKIFSRL